MRIAQRRLKVALESPASDAARPEPHKPPIAYHATRASAERGRLIAQLEQAQRALEQARARDMEALTPVPSPTGRGEEDGGRVEGFDIALRYYRHALIYALRYNRFLLDEVLSGHPQGTPLRPIISECLKHGEEGWRMLIALRDWWQSGTNDIGTPCPNTISPIPEGIALLEAEHIPRQREPGDGSLQRSVVEQIENAVARRGSEA